MDHLFKVPAALFKENRTRLVAALKDVLGGQKGQVVVLEGGIEKNRYNTDAADLPFRQESYFFWTFGVVESEFFGAIDVDTGKTILFAKKLDPSYAIWDGKIHPTDYFKTKYEVDEVIFNEKNTIAERLQNLNAQRLLLLKAENTDSDNTLAPATFDNITKFATDDSILYKVIAELRVIKTEKEIDVLRYASKIASEAHRAAMQHTKPGLYEYQLER